MSNSIESTLSVTNVSRRPSLSRQRRNPQPWSVGSIPVALQTFRYFRGRRVFGLIIEYPTAVKGMSVTIPTILNQLLKARMPRAVQAVPALESKTIAREECERRQMTTQQTETNVQQDIARHRDQLVHAQVSLRSMGQPNSVAEAFDFWDDRYEGRRLFSEVLGTFLLVLVAVGGSIVDARFPGSIPLAARVVAPGLMVAAIILFMGAVSGAHLNPAVTLAFATRGNFPWKRVPAYIVAEFVGASLAALLLWGMLGKFGPAGLTLPGHGVTNLTAFLTEMVLTAGLVSVILGTASGAQQLGPIAALGVGFYIALAGLWAAPVSGASMNPARSLGPALVFSDWTSWWVYLAGPIAGGAIAVGIAYVLRGPGGGTSGTKAAQGTLGTEWRPETIGAADPAPSAPKEAG
jgi:aquaporin Z